jgi:hypothetical protein
LRIILATMLLLIVGSVPARLGIECSLRLLVDRKGEAGASV